MSLTITVPERFSWVLLTSVGAGFLTIWQSAVVGKARKAAAIPYPQAYAEKAETEKSKEALIFNCAQRAHLNTLEHLPQTLLCLLITGVRYPELAAGLGTAWLFGRVLYTKGYISGEPKKRNRGAIGSLSAFGLQLSATWIVGKLVLSTF